ncbi:MAG: hypothetical protein DCC49_07275 [Acidobacteria bacterium]|nr:MAG: hypothetical protein DCC49_07275 [Acidobacteriota bacterium]
MRRARGWSDTQQGRAAELATLACEFDNAASLIEDAIVRIEGEGRIGTKAKVTLAELYRHLALCSLGGRKFDSALLHAQRAYDMAEAANGPLSPTAVPSLVLRSELAWIRGSMAESKSTAERAYAVAAQERTEPAESAPAFLRGATLAYLAGKLPDARAAASEAGRLSSDFSGTAAATWVSAKALLARIKWAGKLREEAVIELAQAGEHAAAHYFGEIALASAEMALTRNERGAAATLLWAPAALRLATGAKLTSKTREAIERSLQGRAEPDTQARELKELLAYFGAGLLSS